jgi:hypothetical protein
MNNVYVCVCVCDNVKRLSSAIIPRVGDLNDPRFSD